MIIRLPEAAVTAMVETITAHRKAKAVTCRSRADVAEADIIMVEAWITTASDFLWVDAEEAEEAKEAAKEVIAMDAVDRTVAHQDKATAEIVSRAEDPMAEAIVGAINRALPLYLALFDLVLCVCVCASACMPCASDLLSTTLFVSVDKITCTQACNVCAILWVIPFHA